MVPSDGVEGSHLHHTGSDRADVQSKLEQPTTDIVLYHSNSPIITPLFHVPGQKIIRHLGTLSLYGPAFRLPPFSLSILRVHWTAERWARRPNVVSTRLTKTRHRRPSTRFVGGLLTIGSGVQVSDS